jgi:prepilin-type N-terminal cleavage/methylation domain-containing protein
VIKNKNGFTLIELMIAVAIIVMVATGSMLSFVQLMILSDSGVNLTIAANDAQYVLEHLKAAGGYVAIPSYSAPVFDNLPNETIANLATIAVNVSWQEKKQTKNYSLSTCFAK